MFAANFHAIVISLLILKWRCHVERSAATKCEA
jgi:hypothetical protein